MPRPLGLSRVNGGWELACEWIPGSASLAELLEGAAPPPAPAPVLAGRLGELLARAHAAGLDHADLHAGNLLVDARGKPWLIDFAHARLRETLAAGRMTRDVMQLAADTRERVAPRARQRFFLAWWKALPAAPRSYLPPRGELAARIELQAREHRLVMVRRNADRWLRGFDACRTLGEGSGLVLARLSPTDEKKLLETMLDTEPGTTTIPHPLRSQGMLLVVEGGGELRAQWTELGRALDHALPAARPAMLLEGRRLRCAFELPAEAQPWREERSDPSPARAAGLERLSWMLDDRGLCPADPRTLWIAPSGEALLGPGSRLEPRRRRHTDG